MIKLIASNKKAYYNYFIKEEYEAGLVLTGGETKSVRLGRVSLKESYAHISKFFVPEIINLNIKAYEQATQMEVQPKRIRRLLLHKKEIKKLQELIQKKGLTLIPLKLYFKNQWIKIKIGVCVGKKLYDKRESIKKKQIEREIQSEIKKIKIK